MWERLLMSVGKRWMFYLNVMLIHVVKPMRVIMTLIFYTLHKHINIWRQSSTSSWLIEAASFCVMRLPRFCINTSEKQTFSFCQNQISIPKFKKIMKPQTMRIVNFMSYKGYFLSSGGNTGAGKIVGLEAEGRNGQSLFEGHRSQTGLLYPVKKYPE